jgi:two-component sensor histidine kinase
MSGTSIQLARTAAATTPANSLRVAIAVLVALPLLVVAMVTGLILLSEREAARALDDRLTSAARVAGAQISSIVVNNLEILRLADDRLGPGPEAFESLSVRDLGEGLASASNSFVAVFTPAGDFIPPAGSDLRQTGIGDNPDFRALAAGAPWRITPLIAQGPSGGRSFAIGRRLEREGEFAGAAVVYLPADLLLESWLNVNLGTDSTLAVIRDDGWLVTRFPVPDATSNVSGSPLFREQLPRASIGGYEATSLLDGVRRRVAYARLDGLPLIVSANMSREVIADGVWRRVQSTALLTAPVVIALVATCVGMILLLRRERKSRIALHGALAQNHMLFQEVHHRVKNNLQTVEAMIRMQPGPAEDKEDISKRIRAMSAVHTHMYESSQFEKLRVDSYIETLADGLRQGNDDRIRVETRLDPLEMQADRAMTLGLLVNEVVLNAFKHAFPNGRSGAIQITLEAQPGDYALLRIRDDGVGGALDSVRVGMGSRLIRGFSRQLGGEPRLWSNEGTEFELRFEVG